jgi:hypothetical protein
MQLVPVQLFPLLVDTTDIVVSLVDEISNANTVAVPTEHWATAFPADKAENSIKRQTNLPDNTDSRVLIIRKNGFYRLGQVARMIKTKNS